MQSWWQKLYIFATIFSIILAFIFIVDLIKNPLIPHPLMSTFAKQQCLTNYITAVVFKLGTPKVKLNEIK